MKLQSLIIPVGLLLLASCSSSDDKATKDKETVSVDAIEMTAVVDTLTLRPSVFSNDIVSNGRVKAGESADMFFRNAELVSEVLVKNGQRVRRGQPLARLDLFKLNAEKSRNEAALEQARLELKDVLIGQGYDPDKSDAIPADVMRLARIRSGLNQAEATYSLTLKDIELSTLSAPFDGVVANVRTNPHSIASVSEPFCRIINDGVMNVEFPILESELPLVAIGEPVEVTPFNGGDKQTGHVTTINPLVDENGHINVSASLSGAKGLIDGMNVRVRSRHSLGDRLIIPKSALVLRSGRQVVFTYKDGKAMWNYVTTGLENLDSYEVVEGLEPGMVLIVTGNENLAHEAPVKFK